MKLDCGCILTCSCKDKPIGADSCNGYEYDDVVCKDEPIELDILDDYNYDVKVCNPDSLEINAGDGYKYNDMDFEYEHNKIYDCNDNKITVIFCKDELSEIDCKDEPIEEDILDDSKYDVKDYNPEYHDINAGDDYNYSGMYSEYETNKIDDCNDKNINVFYYKDEPNEIVCKGELLEVNNFLGFNNKDIDCDVDHLKNGVYDKNKQNENEYLTVLDDETSVDNKYGKGNNQNKKDVKVKTKKYVNYTQEQRRAVVEALKTRSYKQVSKDFKIPKSTIDWWAKKYNMLLETGKKTVKPASKPIPLKPSISGAMPPLHSSLIPSKPVCVYKPRKYGNYTQEQRQSVLKALETKSYGQVSKDFKIPKATIIRWAKNPNIILGTGGRTVLSPLIEKKLVEALHFSASSGVPQLRENLKDMVQFYVLSSGMPTPFKDGRPGRNWTSSFERRHNINLSGQRDDLSNTKATGLTEDHINKLI